VRDNPDVNDRDLRRAARSLAADDTRQTVAAATGRNNRAIPTDHAMRAQQDKR